MIRKLMKIGFGTLISMLIFVPVFSQNQACPININYNSGDLTHWQAYTGNNTGGNVLSGNINLQQNISIYDSTQNAPSGTIGAKSFPEYNLGSVNGIQVITNQSADPYGGFLTIPTINGYSYNYSIQLGSTSITHGNANGGGGGYVRGVSYKINVPATPASQPYTMTYAYAMVLENGAHNSNFQPMARAIISTKDGVIDCASPKYFLPASGANSRGGDAYLDTAAAIANGFSLSPVLSPNANPNSNQPNAAHLQDVWWKGWTEVTFDLSPYRGQQVTLTFEADNCVPGGHFSYAYIAIRNTCAGLLISGDSVACQNSNAVYSIPALQGASYQWSVPADWVINSGGNSNILKVTVGQNAGYVIAREQNSCADLVDTLNVTTKPPTIPGNVTADAEVCAGINTTLLSLSNNTGDIIGWVSSTNGTNWTAIPNLTNSYTALNLNNTTQFKALVQNGPSCSLDSSTVATITVDPKSIGGQISPLDTNYCAGQIISTLFTLKGNTGNVVNWQTSLDSVNWSNILPQQTGSTYNVTNLANTQHYRAIVQSGVCPVDSSSVANIYLYPAAYPQAAVNPMDTTICYGNTAALNALVSVGTNYSWVNTEPLNGPQSGSIPTVPSTISAIAAPLQSTYYVLNIQNTGCPNTLTDSIAINVIPPIWVNVVSDTFVVINQPVQFNASTNDSTEDQFLWTPPSYLDNPYIPNPIGIYGPGVDSITYTVKATDGFGCFGLAKVRVKVFKTMPDIFVPNAFTPEAGSNNIFRPIPVGVSTLLYFRVYNRWGQLVYTTSQFGRGWDGTLGGRMQDAGTFVWMVAGIDYTGKPISKKGTMVLIR
ncbi:MAG: gliding motility-associated C-terminal domain-containing protein [Bacteroidetes bacterium]|nr:gliding motility-associated C-terminal domain-containing protein [Bacteroidota bacterium]